MSGSTTVRVRRLPTPTDGPPGQSRSCDYSDAFELLLPEPDGQTAEQWVRTGLEQAPRALRGLIIVAQRGLLRFRLGPSSSPGHVLGWEIVQSAPDIVHLRASSPIMRAAILAERRGPASVSLATYLYFDRPRTARVLWAVVGPIHRRVARYLMQHAADQLLDRP